MGRLGRVCRMSRVDQRERISKHLDIYILHSPSQFLEQTYVAILLKCHC
jgi:hypothetical protein